MPLVVEPEPVPLVTEADGVVRVGTTRVTLDTVVAAFSERAIAEEIVQQYPTLQLADVYSRLSAITSGTRPKLMLTDATASARLARYAGRTKPASIRPECATACSRAVLE